MEGERDESNWTIACTLHGIYALWLRGLRNLGEFSIEGSGFVILRSIGDIRKTVAIVGGERRSVTFVSHFRFDRQLANQDVTAKCSVTPSRTATGK